jgi:branched-chain amino acid transport system ATP-binding protein
MLCPQLLMLDEPSLGLAPLLVEEIFLTVARLHDEGMTILLVEQNVQQSLRLAETAYVLESGRITLHGRAKDLLDDPKIQSAYLGLDPTTDMPPPSDAPVGLGDEFQQERTP